MNTQVNVTLSIFLHNTLGWLFDFAHTRSHTCFTLSSGVHGFKNHYFQHLPHSFDPLWTIHAAKKHWFSSYFLCRTLQTALHMFQLHYFTISQRALMLLLCSKFLLPIFQEEIWTHTSYTYFSFDKTDTTFETAAYTGWNMHMHYSDIIKV